MTETEAAASSRSFFRSSRRAMMKAARRSSWISIFVVASLLFLVQHRPCVVIAGTPPYNSGWGGASRYPGRRSDDSSSPYSISPFGIPASRANIVTSRHHQSPKVENTAAIWNAKERYAQQQNQLRAGGQFGAAAQNINQAITIAEQVFRVLIETLSTVAVFVLPPVTAITKIIAKFYRALPQDAIIAQAGLVYCFAGGYYPALFAAVQAAQRSGLTVMLDATRDLVEEGTKAIDAVVVMYGSGSNSYDETWTPHQRFGRTTRMVLASVDPVKINTAVGALYTTWLGISSVLEKQFAKTITLSLTIADCLLPFTTFILSPPLKLAIPKDMHQWIPFLLGWSCKAVAMSFAWRIQRVLSASASAVAGGLMFSRAILRMIFRRRSSRADADEKQIDIAEATFLDEAIGLAVAGLGLHAQIGSGFDFTVPFPLSLVTWPFDALEYWIQWQITKEATE